MQQALAAAVLDRHRALRLVRRERPLDDGPDRVVRHGLVKALVLPLRELREHDAHRRVAEDQSSVGTEERHGVLQVVDDGFEVATEAFARDS